MCVCVRVCVHAYVCVFTFYVRGGKGKWAHHASRITQPSARTLQDIGGRQDMSWKNGLNGSPRVNEMVDAMSLSPVRSEAKGA